MKLRLVVLDIAGTTVNDFGLVQKAAMNTMKEKLAVDVTLDDANKVMGIPKYAEKGSIELMPHAGELFESIRACGSQVYLNTGFNRAIAEVIVHNLNLGNVLNGYIGSDEVMAGRPQPDMIRLAMKRSGVEYSHFVMKVGDTISDLYEGFSAGCAWNVGVLTGANTYEELRTAPYSQILSNLQPLLGYFPKPSGLLRSRK
ncbi:MAG: hypothetical protein RLZZ47_957 [Bacteroidota bacterium]